MVKSLPKALSTLLATLALLLVAVACDNTHTALLPEASAPEASAEQTPMVSLVGVSWGEILADLGRIKALEPGQRTEAEAFIARLPKRIIQSYANPPNLDGVVFECHSHCAGGRIPDPDRR